MLRREYSYPGSLVGSTLVAVGSTYYFFGLRISGVIDKLGNGGPILNESSHRCRRLCLPGMRLKGRRRVAEVPTVSAQPFCDPGSRDDTRKPIS